MWKYCTVFIVLANEMLSPETRIKYSHFLSYTRNLTFSHFTRYQRITRHTHCIPGGETAAHTRDKVNFAIAVSGTAWTTMQSALIPWVGHLDSKPTIYLCNLYFFDLRAVLEFLVKHVIEVVLILELVELYVIYKCIIINSQNNLGWRDFWRSPSQTPCPKQAQLDPLAQEFVR